MATVVDVLLVVVLVEVLVEVLVVDVATVVVVPAPVVVDDAPPFGEVWAWAGRTTVRTTG